MEKDCCRPRAGMPPSPSLGQLLVLGMERSCLGVATKL